MKVNKLRNKENQIINGPLEIKPKIFNDDRFDIDGLIQENDGPF